MQIHFSRHSLRSRREFVVDAVIEMARATRGELQETSCVSKFLRGPGLSLVEKKSGDLLVFRLPT
jgi:hypothetical protein